MNPMMNLSFENKVALVTGAGSGMGLTTARAFAEAGAAVALAGLNRSGGRSAGEELGPPPHKAIDVTCDGGDEAGVGALVGQTITAFGGLDDWVGRGRLPPPFFGCAARAEVS